MALSDQQLRQELISYGETVPPITQRNREQLRARLENLRSRKRTPTASPSRSHASASPSRTRATAASPARSHGSANSPSRTRGAASPSRGRSNAATTPPLAKTRSKQKPNLIELSDSEPDSVSTGVLMSRSVRSGQTARNVQTRSIPVPRQNKSPTRVSPSRGTENVTNDVEQSIARHRREIKELLDSARDRNNTGTPSSRSGQHQEKPRTPTGRTSPSPSSKSRTRRHSSKSDDDDDDDDDHHDSKSKRSSKSDKKSSALKTLGKPFKSVWKYIIKPIKNLLKILLVSSILLSGYLYLTRGGDLFPHHEAIRCSIKNATECDEMKPIIAAVRKQLRIRTGEVDCGFRPATDVLVNRTEIERNLNERGLKFNLGDDERWKALITYISQKPISDILIWTEDNQKTAHINLARKLSTTEAERSLVCRARKDVSKSFKNLGLLILGSTGLLTLAYYLQRHSKSHDDNETTFKDYLTKATDLVKEQYEKHVQDPNAQPWLTINHIRDKLIPEHDQERLKHVWERVKKEISKQDSRIRSALHEVNGEKHDIWEWIKSAASSSKKGKSSSKNEVDESDTHTTSETGLTECLKLRNCFRSDNYADDEEIDHVVDSVQKRCAHVKGIEHIGIHSVFVYLKFSSKEAAAHGYRLLNNWHFEDRLIDVKYVRLNRYYEHFPEAQDAGSKK